MITSKRLLIVWLSSMVLGAVGLCQSQDLISIGRSPGQELVDAGVDTTSVDQLKAILGDTQSTLRWTVLRYVSDNPRIQLAGDVAACLQSTDAYLRFAAATALASLDDSRGVSFLDSVITAPTIDRVGLDRKFRAIELLAKRGLYLYESKLLDSYSQCTATNTLEGTAYSAMLAYASHTASRNDVISAIINSYPSAGIQAQTGILYLLSSIGDARSDQYLLTILETDTSTTIRSLALSYLAGRPNASFRDYVFQAALSETNVTLRKQFCNYIRSIGSPEAIWTLEKLLTSETDEDIRWFLGFWTSNFDVMPPPSDQSTQALLDSLKSYEHTCLASGWLADANFVKELDNGLDNAKKHLAKGDSVNAYKEVQKFQEKVNKEYEKTRDSQKKNKPRDKRFVTVEGWKFLYYHAQYIMDRLRSEKKK